MTLAFAQTKQFEFTWTAAPEVEYYQLLERQRPTSPYAQLGDDIVGSSQTWTMPLHLRPEAGYVLRACNGAGCTDSAAVDVADSLASAVGYFKASNTDSMDRFGTSVALSADGRTLAVSAPGEGSNGSDESNNGLSASGAVYVFTEVAGAWKQSAYLKPLTPGSNDNFGMSLALSDEGNLLVVGAPYEDGPDDSIKNSGAAYIFTLADGNWQQTAYLRAPDAGSQDSFGATVAVSGDAQTVAVGADYEGSGAGAVYVFRGANWLVGPPLKAANGSFGHRFGGSLALSYDGNILAVGAHGENSLAPASGAVYMFSHVDAQWSQRMLKAPSASEGENFGWSVALSSSGHRLAVGARKETVHVFERGNGGWSSPPGGYTHLQAPNGDPLDRFGSSVALSREGDRLAVGAVEEDSQASGVDGDGVDNSLSNSGAVYVFSHADDWQLESYVKAPNPGGGDFFGASVALAGNDGPLAVGAFYEDGSVAGINADQNNRSATDAGAAYLY